jgi:uncharacterized protein YukE
MQGLASGALYVTLLPERTESYAISTSLVAMLWAMASMFISGWLTISIRLYSTELEKLTQQRELSSSELGWLESQLQSTNKEISKYLHGILQSRLMAHALSMEDKGSLVSANVDEVLEDLEQVMARPLDSFFEAKGDLRTELQRVSDRWKGFIEVKFGRLYLLSEQANDATMQILQEALSNATRHGNATAAEIEILDDESERVITVKDNGRLQTGGQSGLGSEIISSLTQGRWGIEQSGQETLFWARVRLET